MFYTISFLTLNFNFQPMNECKHPSLKRTSLSYRIIIFTNTRLTIPCKPPNLNPHTTPKP